MAALITGIGYIIARTLRSYHWYNKRMPLTIEEVTHIADLARLSLTNEELALYREQLSAILDYASRLQQVDTHDVPATSSVLPLQSVLREDVVVPGLELDAALMNASSIKNRQFKVPPVLDS